jgi:hypothetical protein
MSEMKKIHGLLDDIVMEDENLDIVETNLSKEEKNRIMEMTLNKAGLKRKSLFGRKSILPLAAAMTLVLSFAAVFAQGGLSNIYYKLFGDSTRYVTEMGTVIDESSSTNGITLNVASMLGDENTFYIIFELIKENGESFENSDYIYFDKLYLELNSSGGYTLHSGRVLMIVSMVSSMEAPSLSMVTAIFTVIVAKIFALTPLPKPSDITTIIPSSVYTYSTLSPHSSSEYLFMLL